MQPSEKLYDLSDIYRMCHGDETQVRRLVDVFIKEFSQALEQLNMAFETHNYQLMRSIIHKLKPALAYYGTLKIEHQLNRLSKALKNDESTVKIESSLVQLNRMKAEVITYLTAHV